MITHSDVLAAQRRIHGRVRRTPILVTEPSALGTSDPVLLKLEQLQLTGSFKVRGAFNKMLERMDSSEMPDSGVVTASGGNAGAAVAYVARQIGVSARVYVPETSPPEKVQRLRDFGARVFVQGSNYAQAYSAALEDSADALFVHAYDDLEVAAGQGTVGLELLEQAESAVDTVLVAVGGGGLLAGVRAALSDQIDVVAVEPIGCPSLHEALHAGQPVDVNVDSIAMDSLGARRCGDIVFDIATRWNVPSLLVPDDAIMHARAYLWEQARVPVEPGGATALAALTSGIYKPEAGERVAVILCGANSHPHW